MAYSEFSLRDALDGFQLALVDAPDLFADVPEVAPGPLLAALLAEFLPLALAINTEKARSELLIAPMLAALRAQMGHRFSVFSGIDFTVDAKQGLSGFCDFILSRSPEQQFLRSPVAAIVEAKNENLKSGLGQCLAAMVGARLFNEREAAPHPAPGGATYGAVTSGSLWRFLRLEGRRCSSTSRSTTSGSCPNSSASSPASSARRDPRTTDVAAGPGVAYNRGTPTPGAPPCPT